MKKIGLLLTAFVLFSSVIYGQHKRAEIMERVESRKIAFLSDKLELSPDEAQVFWPLHNSYQEEIRGIHRSKDARRDFMNDDYDHEAALEKLIQTEEEELAIRKEFAYKFKDAIGARKTILYYHFERKFKEDLLQELRERRRKGAGGLK
ncbi:MAG: hypothetical protein ACO3M5_10045 [Saprospiraceae bacterium]|jgi:hypothetical protein